MKKSYLLLILFLLATIGYQVHAVSISGSRTVCSGETVIYTVHDIPSCWVQIDGPDGLDDGFYTHSAGTWTFSITWNNTTLANKTDNFIMYFSADYWSGCDPYYEVPMSVTIKPNITSVVTPSTPSVTYIDGRLYEFTTSSSNAFNYEWIITGGTISGSSNGKTIRVLRNTSSPTITAKVRGYSAGCNGNVYSSYSGVKPYTVPPPPFGYIDGTMYLYPYSTGTYTPFFTSSSSEQGNVTSWSLSDPGGKLTMVKSGNFAYVSIGAPTATLYFATITCTVTNVPGSAAGSVTKSKTLTYGGSSGSSLIGRQSETTGIKVYPNPANVGQDITLAGLEKSSVDTYMVLDQTGSFIYQNRISTLQSESIATQSLPPGTYYLKFMSKGELIETRRLIIK